MAEISFKEEVGGAPDLQAAAAGRSEMSRRRRIAASHLAHWLWYDRSVRAQLLGTFAAMNLVAVLAATIIVIYNGQRAINAELTASVEVAERFVRGTVEWFTRDESRALKIEDLAVRLSLRHPRHVRILAIDADGHEIPPQSGVDGPSPIEGGSVPRWFQALLHVENLRRDVPVVSGGRQVGTIVV